MVGFDILWDYFEESPFTPEEWVTLRKLQALCVIDEICPSPNVWHFLVKEPLPAEFEAMLRTKSCIAIIG